MRRHGIYPPIPYMPDVDRLQAAAHSRNVAQAELRRRADQERCHCATCTLAEHER
jgi:hypothetical protein